MTQQRAEYRMLQASRCSSDVFVHNIRFWFFVASADWRTPGSAHQVHCTSHDVLIGKAITPYSPRKTFGLSGTQRSLSIQILRILLRVKIIVRLSLRMPLQGFEPKDNCLTARHDLDVTFSLEPT